MNTENRCNNKMSQQMHKLKTQNCEDTKTRVSACCQYRVVVTLLLSGARFRNEALQILDFKKKLAPYPWQQLQKRKGLSMQFHYTTDKSQYDNMGCYKVATKNSETFTNHFNTTVFPNCSSVEINFIVIL